MVARVVWDHEAAGSSPVTSTSGEPPLPSRELHLGEVRDFFARAFTGILMVQPSEAWTHAASQVRPFLLPFRWRLRRVSKLSA